MPIMVTIKNEDVEEFRKILGNNIAEVTREFKTFRVDNSKFLGKLIEFALAGYIFAGHILARPAILFVSDGTKMYQVPTLDYSNPACTMQTDGTILHEAEARAYIKARKAAADYLGV